MQMYDIVDISISIIGGAYVYLTAIGKIDISKDKEKSKLWIEKYGKIMKIIGPILILFGLYKLTLLLWVKDYLLAFFKGH